MEYIGYNNNLLKLICFFFSKEIKTSCKINFYFFKNKYVFIICCKTHERTEILYYMNLMCAYKNVCQEINKKRGKGNFYFYVTFVSLAKALTKIRFIYCSKEKS